MLDGHWKHRFYENAEIALALPLCSEIARRCQHQGEKPNESQPEMLIKPMKKTNDFSEFQRSLGYDWPDKVRGQTPPAAPL